MAATSSGQTLSRDAVHFLYNHVFLPPQLPQSDDFTAERDLALMQVTRDGLASLKGCIPKTEHDTITATEAMLRTMQNIHKGGDIAPKQLVEAFHDLATHGHSIALHVRAQNAGILISKAEGKIHFDVFELSPTNHAAMSTKGRLRRTFPAASVSISIANFQLHDFQQTLSETLASMSAHRVAGMLPQVKKAGQLHDEDRDTAHPAMITEVLLGFLSAVGEPHASPTVAKNTREEVRWKNARSPWRRSPTWLLIRVALQLTLRRLGASHYMYKQALLFVMCRIEDLALKTSVPSDALYVMNAKIAQRVLKLWNNIDLTVSTRIQKTTVAVHNRIQTQWTAAQKQNSRQLDLSTLSTLNFGEDTEFSLPAVDEYIEAILKRQSNSQAPRAIDSNQLVHFPADELPTLSTRDFAPDEMYALANLYGLETWVGSHCKQWAEARPHLTMLSSTRAIGTLIKDYHRLASKYYEDNPESLSVMVLTILELWVACDQGSCAAIALLNDYELGLDQGILQSLLLPSRSHMERLRAVEHYLQRRALKASKSYTQLFAQVDSPHCFAVRYFEQCSEMQTTKDRILKLAEQERKSKIEQFHQVKQEYTDLMHKHNNMECDMKEVVVDHINGFTEKEHHHSCRKCGYLEQASNMTIGVHEWPLPRSDAKSKTIVFELQVPPLFATWRETTLHVVKNVLQARYHRTSMPRASYYLRADQHLKAFYTAGRETSRLTLLSEDKPNIGTHRKLKNISLSSEDDVCVNSGLDYHYYDTYAGTFLGGWDHDDAPSKDYTYQLPYIATKLQKFIFRPASSKDGPPPNAAIADQADCPKHLSLEEYKDLATVALGHRIQWYNILLNLCAPTIDFRKDETALVIFQCIYQTGPLGEAKGALRESHHILRDDAMGQKLLDSIAEAFGRVKGNWESAQSLCLFSAIVARILSLTDSLTVQRRCVVMLLSMRSVAFGWVSLLRTRAQQAATHEIRAELQSKSVDVALICALTFEVDDAFLTDMLCSAKNASVLIQCSIFVQEGKKTYAKASDPVLFICQSRFRRLLRRCCTMLCHATAGLNDAIKQAWPAFQPTGLWIPLEDHEDHWVSTETTIIGFETKLPVHYNSLSGELLVNGLPLDRPPREYEDHPEWIKLFGTSAIEVMPTVVPGMQFSLKQKYRDHEVHVGFEGIDLASGQRELVVRASSDLQTYSTIPSRLFQGEVSSAFVQGCVHWFNHHNHTVDFLPLQQPWTRDNTVIWTLCKNDMESRWRLIKQDHLLVKSKSNTAQAIGGILEPIAEPLSTHIILNPSRTTIDIEVPSLELGFCLHAGDSFVSSQEFPGMCIDGNQSITTLTGFNNKLLLKCPETEKRVLLIPEGSVSCGSSGHHVSVSVDRSSISKVHKLEIDPLLGRLVDNGSLQCKLFLAHMHALTSFCLPDDFTGYTGTEHCLSILNSAAVHSFDQLSEANVATLQEIASLTPGRAYYPANEQVMQTTSFSSKVSFLAQDNAIFTAVQSIFKQAEETRVFYPDMISTADYLPRISQKLIERDSIRSSTFCVSGFGAENFKSTADDIYHARDNGQQSARLQHAHSLSSIVYRNLQSRHIVIPLEHLWEESKKVERMMNTNKVTPTVAKYDPQLVKDGIKISQWMKLHRGAMSNALNTANRFNTMMWLATVAASEKMSMATLQILALMHTTPTIYNVELPDIGDCSPSQGVSISKDEVENVVQMHLVSLKQSPEGALRKKAGEDRWTFESRRDALFAQNKSTAKNVLIDRIWRQWPSDHASLPDLSDQPVKPDDYVNMAIVMNTMQLKFKGRFDNLQLRFYFEKIQEEVFRLPNTSIHAPTWHSVQAIATSTFSRFIATQHILSLEAPVLKKIDVALMDATSASNQTPQYSRLTDLIEALEASSASAYEKAYARELRESLNCLKEDSGLHSICVEGQYSIDELVEYQAQCHEQLARLFTEITAHIQQTTGTIPGAAISITMAHYPRVSRSFVLRLLNRHFWPDLHASWRECAIEYALAITAAHRSDRLVKAARSGNQEDLIAEILNVGHTNWDPHLHPESLLLEAESGIMIRSVQGETAAQMRDPSPGHNAVMQLNMGEGKSSVVLPLVAASLADTFQLVRVVVAKPQSKQMLQMLVSKLGGLIDRKIRQLPFSRCLKLDKAGADSVGAFVRGCMTAGDVLLVQPEHILSFRLMVLECFGSGDKQAIGQSLLSTQLFFDNRTRDIVDESDENFSTKFELIYTMGTQRQIEFSPTRWNCVQQVLELVRRFAPVIAAEHPDYVELSQGDIGGSRRFRFLKQEAAALLNRLIATYICETGIEGFPIARQPMHIRDSVHRYLVKLDLSDAEIADVENLGPGSLWDSATAKSSLLLLRGLLAGGILAFVFLSKRWRVQYGLVTTRTPPTQLAVPYRAKDNPTPRSEFSHPDVMLVLTSLSYYYGGMTDEDIFTALKHLMLSDQADAEYKAWIDDVPAMPHQFHQLEGINVRDRIQCILDIFPHLRYGKAVVDYFLANVVFPKEMKEFPYKLSASGWDIGMRKAKPTTGFSGTNDSKKLLPLAVEHLDLPRQKHTNALVLHYALDPRNGICLMRNTMSDFTSYAERLLDVVIHQEEPVQVILDVGAQILELNNYEVALRWLEMHPNPDGEIQAVVFFNDAEELSVLDRKGRVESLQTSSYLSRLDKCLVFLDEAHTRGTDLPLPRHYRAAVTLGANLTKDRLVQACMRMRKLGKGQTVVFCINSEIEDKIRARVSKSPNATLELADVLIWSIAETHAEIRRAMPQWAVQGKRFLTQEQHWNEASVQPSKMSKALSEKFLEAEAQTLEDRYRPKSTGGIGLMNDLSTPRMQGIRDRCAEFEDLQFNASTLQEEQERELSPEIEQERQVERPARASPAKHDIHPDVVLFISSGGVKSRSHAYMPAFEALQDTTAADGFELSQLAGNNRLLVTRDFARTIQTSSSLSYKSDAYQRAVQWILVTKPHCQGLPCLMVLSPYEAEHLMPNVQVSSKVALHLYKPRCNAGFRTLDQLDYMSIPVGAETNHIPRSLLLQLDVFAGQLYLSTYADYLQVCAFLGLATSTPKDGEVVAADGFIIKDNDGVKPGSSPVHFLQALMSKIRRNGQGIGKTDMGFILEGKILEKSHFDGRD